jgi:hypothetical protein
MDIPRIPAGGDLVYLSVRKLDNLSIQLGLPTDVRGPLTDTTVHGAVGVNLGPMAHAELGGDARGEPGRPEPL